MSRIPTEPRVQRTNVKTGTADAPGGPQLANRRDVLVAERAALEPAAARFKSEFETLSKRLEDLHAAGHGGSHMEDLVLQQWAAHRDAIQGTATQAAELDQEIAALDR